MISETAALPIVHTETDLVARATGASPKMEEADDRQIHYLYTQLQELLAHALDLDQKVKKEELENPADRDPDLEQAKTAVLTMRSTAEQIGHELSSAGTDRTTGKKRMSATRVATLTAAVEHVIHASERDKTALIDVPAEKKSTAAKIGSLCSVAAAPIAIKSLSHISAAIPGAATSSSAIRSPIGAWLKETGQSIRGSVSGAIDSIHQAFSNFSERVSGEVAALTESEPVQAARQYASRAAQAVTEFVQAPIEHMKRAGQAAANIVDQRLVKPASNAASSTLQTAKDVYESAVDATSSGIEWIANAPGRAKEWVSGIFGTKTDATPAAVQKIPQKTMPAAPNMARAMAQAMGISLPVGSLLNQPIDSLMSLSAQTLPHLHASVGSLVGFP